MSFVRAMTAVLLTASFLCVAAVAALAAPAAADGDDGDPWSFLRQRDEITIAITDSGLGGLSVVADAERKLREHGVYADVNLVFYNALFQVGGGYNSLPDRQAKIRVFSRVLQGLQDHFAPDIILIACNTLSVIYQDTPFAAATGTPVVGIVEDGVDLIASRLLPDPDSRVILFATQTTVDENSHKAALMDRGIAGERIVTQACPELAAYIERGFDSLETSFLIDAYVSDAITGLGDSGGEGAGAGPLYVSFNCTHYGYALDAWRDAFAAHDVAVAEFLNPNTTMIDFLLPAKLHGRHRTPVVKVRVVSQVEIAEERRASLGRYLQSISPATVEALQGYELRADLFTWQDVLSDPGTR